MKGHKAAKPNPALMPLSGIIGEWRTTGKHPYFPDKTFHGRTSFEWLEGGAFLIMRSHGDETEIPAGIAIIGSDDALGRHFMLYFDERGVSRMYDIELLDNGLVWTRDDPKFRQRFTTTIASDGQTMSSHGEMSRDGGPWEQDLQVSYSRLS